MLNTMERVLMAVSIVEFIIGMFGNGFIGLVYCIAWTRSQKLYMIDFILVSLTCSRFSELCLIIASLHLLIFAEDIHGIVEYSHGLTITWILSNHLSIWFTTCLAVLYFLKIAHFSHPLFFWLRWRINKVIFTLLLGSLPCLCVTFPTPYGLNIFWYHAQNKSDRNTTGSQDVSKMNNFNFMIAYLTGTFPPFALSLASFVLLLFSLKRHTQQLELNTRHPRDLSMEAHYRAMKTVFSLLVLFLLRQVALLMMFVGQFLLYCKVTVILAFIVGLVGVSGNSYIVIFGNSQISTAFFWMLSHLPHILKGKVVLSTARI